MLTKLITYKYIYKKVKIDILNHETRSVLRERSGTYIVWEEILTAVK